MTEPKMFPLQTQRDVPPGPRQIPWSVAEIAYGEYSRQYGSSQSLQRLADRGGFGWGEMDAFHPKWREEVSEIFALRAQVAKLQAFKDYVHGRLDAAGVPADPDSPHRAAGCRIGGRLDAVLAGWTAERPRPAGTLHAPAYCPHCETDTPHEIWDAGHERDSSNDWTECVRCGSRWSGLTGEHTRPQVTVSTGAVPTGAVVRALKERVFGAESKEGA